ncbi:hypothetical protein MJM83_34675, partial [Salmonella enterica subsp. enterica serovar Montevideo]|nr:hypothetical protein [Salmonella enterica subsp. enterica serovar Montevideo]
HDEPLLLPATKDPEITARWIERCLAGHEPVPQSLKTQMACCLRFSICTDSTVPLARQKRAS